MVTRRQMLRMGGSAALGISGAVALAACGETKVVTREVPVDRVVVKEVEVEKIVTQQVEKIVTQEVERIVRQEVPVERVVEVQKVVEVPVEKVVEKVVTREVEKVVERVVEVEVAPTRVNAVIRFAHDHSSGLRGKQMQWALDRFAQVRPDIAVKFEPQNHMFQDSFGIQLAGGSQAEAALLDGGFFHQWADKGGFVQINSILDKHPDWNPKNYGMWPDQQTINFANSHPIPFNQGIVGPAFGLPFQAGMNGVLYNYTLFEEVGIPQPSPGNWGIQTDFLDAMRALTDADKGQFGFRSSNAMWGFWAGWGRALADGNQELLYYDETASRMTIFDDGAHRGHDFVVDAIWQEGISNKLEDAKALSGEFSDPFSAGKMGVTNFGSAGNYVVRIAGRFDWGINIQPEGPRGEAPIHTSEQPHLVTNAAESNGVMEQTVDMLVFFAGAEVQERAAIDRGFIPVNLEVHRGVAMKSAPPQGHDHITRILTSRDDHQHWQSAHPSWWEWFDGWRGGSDRSLIGEATAEEGREALMAASNNILDSQHDAWLDYKAWAGTLSS